MYTGRVYAVGKQKSCCKTDKTNQQQMPQGLTHSDLLNSFNSKPIFTFSMFLKPCL